MTLQTIEIHGERFVILPEKDFLTLQNRSDKAVSQEIKPKRFRDIVPIRVGGTPVSEVIIQDRR